MIRRVICILIILFAAPAMAETAVVRSGAHPGFSRLVLEFDTPVAWSYRRRGTSVLLSIERKDLSLDFSQVFNRIGHERLANIALVDGEIIIDLNADCGCALDLFELRPGLLVVDARDPGTEPSHPELLVAADESPERPRRPTTPARKAVLPRAELPVYGDFAPDTHPEPIPDAAPSVSTALEASQNTRQAVQAMQSLLVEQLGRAAAQGLVDAELPFDPLDPPSDSLAQTEPLPDTPKTQAQLDAHTSMDRDLGELPFVAMTDLGRPCLAEELVTVSGWNPDANFGTSIAAGRRELYREFDKLDPVSARRLARNYLYFGFGAEAIAILNLIDTPTEGDRVQQEIGRLLDSEPIDDLTLFQNQIGCASAAAMWAALALPELPPNTEMNREAIVLSFSDLPGHVRQNLGPRLAKRFIDRGDLAMAAHLRQTITRAIGSENPALLDAQMTRARGEDLEADRKLSNLAEANTDDAPQALIALFQRRWADGYALSPDQVALAEALAFEHRATETGKALVEAAILSMSRNKAFDAAFDRLNALSEDLALQIRDQVFAELVSRGQDAAFLHHVLARNDSVQTLHASTKMNIADRLLDLDLTQSAQRILGSEPGEDNARFRFLQARIALARGAPRDALNHLAGQSDEPAQLLRAQAYSALGQWQRAADAYDAAGDTDGAHRAAWHAGDWEALGAEASEPERQMADYMRTPSPAKATAEPTLAEAASQLTRSASLRDALASLLQRPES